MGSGRGIASSLSGMVHSLGSALRTCSGDRDRAVTENHQMTSAIHDLLQRLHKLGTQLKMASTTIAQLRRRCEANDDAKRAVLGSIMRLSGNMDAKPVFEDSLPSAVGPDLEKHATTAMFGTGVRVMQSGTNAGADGTVGKSVDAKSWCIHVCAKLGADARRITELEERLREQEAGASHPSMHRTGPTTATSFETKAQTGNNHVVCKDASHIPSSPRRASGDFAHEAASQGDALRMTKLTSPADLLPSQLAGAGTEADAVLRAEIDELRRENQMLRQQQHASSRKSTTDVHPYDFFQRLGFATRRLRKDLLRESGNQQTSERRTTSRKAPDFDSSGHRVPPASLESQSGRSTSLRSVEAGSVPWDTVGEQGTASACALRLAELQVLPFPLARDGHGLGLGKEGGDLGMHGNAMMHHWAQLADLAVIGRIASDPGNKHGSSPSPSPSSAASARAIAMQVEGEGNSMAPSAYRWEAGQHHGRIENGREESKFNDDGAGPGQGDDWLRPLGEDAWEYQAARRASQVFRRCWRKAVLPVAARAMVLAAQAASVERMRLLLRDSAGLDERAGRVVQVPLFARPRSLVISVNSTEGQLAQAHQTSRDGRGEEDNHSVEQLLPESGSALLRGVPALPPSPWLWAADGDHVRCALCEQEFAFLVRQHHCRCCGMIVCANCSAFTQTMTNKGIPVSSNAFEAPASVMREIATEGLLNTADMNSWIQSKQEQLLLSKGTEMSATVVGGSDVHSHARASGRRIRTRKGATVQQRGTGLGTVVEASADDSMEGGPEPDNMPGDRSSTSPSLDLEGHHLLDRWQDEVSRASPLAASRLPMLSGARSGAIGPGGVRRRRSFAMHGQSETFSISSMRGKSAGPTTRLDSINASRQNDMARSSVQSGTARRHTVHRPPSVSGQSWGWASGASGSRSAWGDPADEEAATELEGWHDVASTAAVPSTLRTVRPPSVPPVFTDAAGALAGPLRVCFCCFPVLGSVPELRLAQVRAGGARLRIVQREASTATELHRQGVLSSTTWAALRASGSGNAGLAHACAAEPLGVQEY